MKQGQVITTNIATGVAYLRENSNGIYANDKRPSLTFINPAMEWVEDGVHCSRPAVSLEVYDPKALYEFLHKYFNDL